MGIVEWCGIIGLALIPVSGLVAWMFTVARDLGMIREKVDGIDDKVNEHAGKLGELNHRTERLEVSLASIKRATT